MVAVPYRPPGPSGLAVTDGNDGDAVPPSQSLPVCTGMAMTVMPYRPHQSLPVRTGPTVRGGNGGGAVPPSQFLPVRTGWL